MNIEIETLVKIALEIIDRQVVLTPFFKVSDSGDKGPVMEAANFFKQAVSIEPNNPHLHYAYMATLRLALQFKTAEEELQQLIKAHPDFALAKFSLEAWKEGAVISPAMFAYPQWSPLSKGLPPFYSDKLKTFVLFPTREGIHPRAVLFEKDNDSWWTENKLKGLKAEVAVVLAPGSLSVAAIYKRCTGPRLAKPDIQESLIVLDLPKDDTGLVAWEYLCALDFVDVAVIDTRNTVIFNQCVQLSDETKSTLGRIRETLLTTTGRKISDQEILRALQSYQNTADLNYIESKYFKN